MFEFTSVTRHKERSVGSACKKALSCRPCRRVDCSAATRRVFGASSEADADLGGVSSQKSNQMSSKTMCAWACCSRRMAPNTMQDSLHRTSTTSSSTSRKPTRTPFDLGREATREAPRLSLINAMQTSSCKHLSAPLICIILLQLLLASSLPSGRALSSGAPADADQGPAGAPVPSDPMVAEASGTNPVRITIQPNDLIAIEGESAELNCDAEGDPEPTIEWFHNGQLIKSSTQSRTTMGGSIQFLDIRPATTPAANYNGSATSHAKQHQSSGSDAGVYHCVARNPFGEAKSRQASLQVAYIKEEFRVAPKSKLAPVGDTVTFDCLPQAWPEPRIRWRRNGQLIEPGESQLADGSAKFIVQKMAKAVEVSNDTSTVGRALLDQGPRPNATADGQLMDFFGSKLTIKQVEKSDEGQYSCLVETKGSHRLIERESPIAELTTAVRPYFIEAPEHKAAEVGGQVRLKCRMGGDPEPVISWRRQNGQPLSEKSSIDPSDKTLILDGLRVFDQGVYICEGENAVGSARAMAQVTVNSRPKFIVQPVDQEVDTNGRAQFNCAGEANPQPLLFWYKEGHRQLLFPPPTSASNPPTNYPKSGNSLPWPQAAALVAQDDYHSPYGSFGNQQISDTSPAINKFFSMPVASDQTPSFSNNYFGNRIYVDNQGTLNIANATSSDNGYYACALISSVGSVLAKAKLTVKLLPNHLRASTDFYLQDPSQARSSSLTSISGKYDLLPPPVIKMGSSNQTLPTNTSTILYCDVVSQVAYKIQWLIEGQPLQEDPPRVTILDSGSLSINDLRISDTGIYTCIVTAANDQNMPLAAPFEPLDPTMLTATPPIQQSVAHSCLLKVAYPTNPNIQFFRMELYAYPSPPGPAYLMSTNGNDAITIAWAPPSDSGILPITQYIVEHFDTSQEQSGWRVIHRPKGRESLLIDGLSAEGSHFFVIRATNNRGTGPSSAIAGPMRTVAGDARYQMELQRRRNPNAPDYSDSRPEANYARERLMTITTNLLNLTPISSTSVRLQWSTQSGGNMSTFEPMIGSPGVGDFLEGFSIRYRAVGMGESLLGKDPLTNARHLGPTSLPLVTSFIDESELDPTSVSREKRDLSNYFDYTQEFNEVRVADHNTEHYTIHGIKPFTKYQFFVVPYYKDIDGVPSNILSVQTYEDKPSVGPDSLSVRAINNTAVRLLWFHIRPELTNGILLGYVIRINRSDQQPSEPRVLNLSLKNLNMAPLGLAEFNADSKPDSNNQKFVVMYDITNLTYRSFYSVQVSGTTSAGTGPSSEPCNFVMDPEKLSDQSKFPGGVGFEDVVSKSDISNVPQPHSESTQSHGFSNLYLVLPCILMIISILLIAGFLLYRRNNQKVITWKKTISEHFTNKFYMPSSVDHHHGPNSIQQNIYDHQQHLIYSAGSTHLAHQSGPVQNMWAASNGANVTGCLNSSGTGSLSSHGGLLPINNDPNAVIRGRDQLLLMNTNNKDPNSRFIRGPNPTNGQLISQASMDSSRSVGSHMGPNQQQIVHHGGDYYSVINNVAEYEELDQQRRNNNNTNMQLISSNSDRHQTGSSNSDTSCPSSVTRLLPNQNYNRDILLGRGPNELQRHEMILQQQIGCNIDSKQQQPFITMINGNDVAKFQSKQALSPYATTNLMNQMAQQQQHHQQEQQQHFNNHSQLQSHQPGFVIQNGGATLDDSSKVFMSHQMQTAGVGGGGQHPITSFRTLQRNPMNFQHRAVPIHQTSSGFNGVNNHQVFLAADGIDHQQSNTNFGMSPSQYRDDNLGVANITSNPLADMKPNLYEHIDYSYMAQQQASHQTMGHRQQQQQQHQQQSINDMLVSSSSASSGSIRSPTQQSQQQQQQQASKFRRASQATNNADSLDNEAHDLRVFSSGHVSRPSDCSETRQTRPSGMGQSIEGEKGLLNDAGGGPIVDGEDDSAQVDENEEQADETTAFRRKSSDQSDNHRTRQLSKRKRQQQRNRLHNNNQKLG